MPIREVFTGTFARVMALAVLCLVCSVSMGADELAKFQFGSGLTPTSSGANLSATAIAANPGGNLVLQLTSDSNPPGAPYLSIDPNGNSTSAAQAVANGKYVEFTVTADAGYELNLETLAFNVARQGDTPRGYVVRSSVDSFASNLATANVPTTRPFYTPVTISLAAPAFQHRSSIAFRIYVFSQLAGNALDFDDIILSGYATQPPTAVDDADVTDEDTPISIPVLANDTDPDLDTLAIFSLNTTGTQGSVAINGSDIDYNPNGKFEALNSTSTTDSFKYTISDGKGGSATATVTVTINGVNDAPVLVVNETISMVTGTVAVVTPSKLRFTDVDNSTLQLVYTLDTLTQNGVVTSNGNPVTAFTQADINNGDIEYTHNGGPSNTDSFDFTVSDGAISQTGTFNFIISATPAITTNLPLMINETESGTITAAFLETSDDNTAAELTYRITGLPTVGTVRKNAIPIALNGTFTQEDVNNFLIEYVHNGVKVTSDSFTFNVSDGISARNDEFKIAINIAPVAVNDTAGAVEDGPAVDITVLANDTDMNSTDVLTLQAVDASATTGAVTSNGNLAVYDPGTNFQRLAVGETTTDTFGYTIRDGNGLTSSATVTVTISGVNDAPAAANDTAAAAEDGGPVNVDVTANDTDPDTTDVLTLQSIDASATIGTVTSNGNLAVYDPGASFQSLFAGETVIETFSYTVRDNSGSTSSATVTVTITGVNDAPAAVDDAAAATEDGAPVDVPVIANDSDADASDLLTLASIDTSLTTGTVTSNGNFATYDPGLNFQSLAAGQTTTDTFTYTVTDSTGNTATATATVTITGVNDNPVANTDTAGAESTVPVAIDVLANDTDIDGGALTVVGATNGAGGSVSFSATGVTYFSAAGFSGPDSFAYTIDDGQGGSATGIVNVNVNPAPQPPEITISSPQPAVTAAGPVVYEITYANADNVTLTTADVTVHRTGTATGVATVVGTTVTLTGVSGNGTLSISLAAGTASKGITLAGTAGPSEPVIVDSLAPELTSGITVENSNGMAGQLLLFRVAVSDASPLVYSWDFGDGTSVVTKSSFVSHVFVLPGVYQVQVTVTDGSGFSTSTQFSITMGSAIPPSDDICAGLNPVAMSSPAIQARLKFPGALLKDSIAFKAVVQLNDEFNPDGQAVQWDIAGIRGDAVLDSRGNSPKSTTIKASIRYKKPKKGEAFTSRPAKLSISMKSQDLSALLLAGIANLNADTAKTGDAGTAHVCVVLTGHQAYAADKPGLYKARQGKLGSFKAK